LELNHLFAHLNAFFDSPPLFDIRHKFVISTKNCAIFRFVNDILLDFSNFLYSITYFFVKQRVASCVPSFFVIFKK